MPDDFTASPQYWVMRAEFAYATYCHLLGSRVSMHQAIYSRMSTPLIGDEVFEESTFNFRLRKGDLSGIGLLCDRLYDINLEVQPPDQDWDAYLWQIDSRNSGVKNNWTNCRFIVLADFQWLENFERYGTRDESDLCFPEDRFVPEKKETWWWLDRREKQKARILDRSARGVHFNREVKDAR